jgi:hypothetical protein
LILVTAPTAPVTHQPPAPARASWGTWRTVLVVLGGLAALLGIGLFLAGSALAVTTFTRDDDGYISSGEAPLRTDSHALTVREIGIAVNGPDIAASRDLLGRVRVQATSTRSGTPLFVGLARQADVERYLTGVGNDVVTDFDLSPFDPSYQRQEGGAPATPPGEQTFWAVADSGTGTNELVWNVAPGDWAIVVMNADGSAGVDADVSVGASLPVLTVVAVTLLVLGGSALATGAVLIVIALGTRSRTPYTTVPVDAAR